MSAHITARLALVGVGALSLVGAAGLAGCGTEGELVRPAPFYGSAARHQYEADRAAGQTSGTSDVDAASRRRAAGSTDSSGSSKDSDDNAPRTKRDIQDPAQKLTPLSAAPIDGPPNPLGPPVSTRPPG